MAATALAAIKEKLDADTYLASILATDLTGAYFQKAPDNTDISTGITLVLDHRGEPWDRLTESRQKVLGFGVLAFSYDFELLDQKVVPALEDILDDAEAWLTIDGHEAYNLEILSVRLGLEEYCDKHGNDVYVADLDCKLEYQRVRKNSTDAFPD